MSSQCPCTGRDDEPRLRDEHAFLERQLVEAIALAEADDWQGFECKWEAFMNALEQHLQYEENQLLPAFAKSGPLADREAKQLRAAHDELRGEVTFLDRETQAPDLFIEQLRYLTQVLRTHKDHEEQVLYPWLASSPQTLGSRGANLTGACSAAHTGDDLWWCNPLRREPGAARSSR